MVVGINKKLDIIEFHMEKGNYKIAIDLMSKLYRDCVNSNFDNFTFAQAVRLRQNQLKIKKLVDNNKKI